jgi:Type III restriction enzyme, res subunit
MQSLARNEELSALLDNYGQVIVDECHHIGAVSFDLLMRRAKAKYVLGLTATPVRRDGQHPIIFMQCGPIRHTAQRPDSAPQRMEVHPIRVAGTLDVPDDAGIQAIFTSLVDDASGGLESQRRWACGDLLRFTDRAGDFRRLSAP